MLFQLFLLTVFKSKPYITINFDLCYTVLLKSRLLLFSFHYFVIGQDNSNMLRHVEGCPPTLLDPIESRWVICVEIGFCFVHESTCYC